MNLKINKFKFSFKNVIIWVLTVGFLLYLLGTTDFNTFVKSLENVNKLFLFSLMILFVVFGLLFDASSIFIFLKGLGFKINLPSLIFLKGSSYLVNILNYHAATTMMAYFLKDEENKSFSEKLSTFILLSLIDLFSLSILAFSGLLISNMEKFLNKSAHNNLILITGIIFISIPSGIMTLKILKKYEMLNFLINNKFIKIIANSPATLLFKMTIIRMLFILHYVLIQFVYLSLFNISVPLKDLLLFTPVITIIATIPISISGLGTTQIAMRIFYSPYIKGISYGVIDAFSTATIIGTILIRAIIGLIFMRKIGFQ